MLKLFYLVLVPTNQRIVRISAIHYLRPFVLYVLRVRFRD